MIIFGLALWIFADKLSVKILGYKDQDYSKEITGISASIIQEVLFTVLGLYFVGESLPQIVSALINIKLVSEAPNAWFNILPKIIGESAQFIFGIILIFGSHGLVVMLKKLREAGVQEIKD